jgi:hypothetical protein
VPHVQRMAALQLRDPILVFIAVKTDNRAFQLAASQLTPGSNSSEENGEAGNPAPL